MPKFLCYFLFIVWSSVQAADIQPLPLIQASAEQHLKTLLVNQAGTLHVKADDLDTRLRLASCATPLEAFLPNGANVGSRVTVGVRCSSGVNWTIYVPVDVESEVSSLILSKALARGAAVTSDDVELRTQRVPGLASNFMTTIKECAGKRLKRDLAAGTVLTPALFEPEVLIRRGQQVMVVAKIAGIEVRTQAIALADGVASSRIKVKNLNSAKVVEGLVDSNSVVRVDL